MPGPRYSNILPNLFTFGKHSNYELPPRGDGRRIPAGNLNKKDRISRYPLAPCSPHFPAPPSLLSGRLSNSSSSCSFRVFCHCRHVTLPARRSFKPGYGGPWRRALLRSRGQGTRGFPGETWRRPALLFHPSKTVLLIVLRIK